MQDDMPLKQLCPLCDHVVELLVDAKATLRQPPPTVLIVTTADVEREALADRLEEPRPAAIGVIDVTIGKLGGRVVAVCQTRQSVTGTLDVVSTLLDSDELKENVKFVSPSALPGAENL